MRRVLIFPVQVFVFAVAVVFFGGWRLRIEVEKIIRKRARR